MGDVVIKIFLSNPFPIYTCSQLAEPSLDKELSSASLLEIMRWRQKICASHNSTILRLEILTFLNKWQGKSSKNGNNAPLCKTVGSFLSGFYY